MMLNERTRMSLTTQFLSDKQYIAAAERNRNVVVTAGAGSGKTRTLVARYLSLLADGLQPDRVEAITFTEKAANEMRSRVRSAIRNQITAVQNLDEQRFWLGLERKMDAARIGTIHSLCAEILRTHPAQAGIDPLFEVVDEGQAAIMIADAVESTLVQITMEEKYVQLFELLRIKSLETILTQMITKRLEVQKWIQSDQSMWQFLMEGLQPFMQMDEMQQCIKNLRSFSPQRLESDTSAKGVEQVNSFLVVWKEVETAWQEQNYLNCISSLIIIRTQIVNRLVGKSDSTSRIDLTTWRGLYDTGLSWIEKGFDAELEEKITTAIPLLKEAFSLVHDHYNKLLSNQKALDFDDLEGRALALLKRPEIAKKWQEKVQALLVDEFQDTNQRQRQLIEALTVGNTGSLYVVGDARQSIYRFRGADVTIFKEVQKETGRTDGLICELEETHRTHPALMKVMDEVLAAVMGSEIIEEKPFHVPFKKMIPVREDLPSGVRKPYLEVLIGAGRDSEEGRILAANLLAERLLAYKQAGEIQDWKDVALLFRASGAFPIYEQALEAAGIPYVTIAGSGFYDRSEIRDLLNLLRALADPWDDLAMVGFLRSPATGMSDLGITQLRWSQSGDQPVSLRQALTMDHSFLTQEDKLAADRALDLLDEFEEVVGKIPVAALLQRLIERTHYRIILAGSAERGWRNIEKLLFDAYTSHQTSIHAYLEYVQKIRDIGVREGEAAGAAEDALQLMTIHKSKGLEFPWVILADAGRRPMTRTDRWQIEGERVSFLPDRVDYKPLQSRYLKMLDEDREEAETRRLLYVAFTRAKDKLIISGHFSQFKEKFTVNGWLKKILDLFDLDPEWLVVNPPAEPVPLAVGERIGLQVSTQLFEFPIQEKEKKEVQVFSLSAMLNGKEPMEPLKESLEPEENRLDLFEPSEKFPLWVGKLLHQSIHRWEYHDDEALQQFLERSALELGFLELEQRKRVVFKAKVYFKRLQEHPVYVEINQASRRYHEVPYELQDEPQNERGRLDVLYQTERGWKIVDFKTDQLASLADLDEKRRSDYRTQLLRYQNSVFQQLKEMPVAQFCFLNCGDSIQLVNLEDF